MEGVIQLLEWLQGYLSLGQVLKVGLDAGLQLVDEALELRPITRSEYSSRTKSGNRDLTQRTHIPAEAGQPIRNR